MSTTFCQAVSLYKENQLLESKHLFTEILREQDSRQQVSAMLYLIEIERKTDNNQQVIADLLKKVSLYYQTQFCFNN